MGKPTVPLPERSQAVLIGVSVHADERIPSYPVLENGVKEVARLFQEPDIWGLPSENCTVVSGRNATQRNISAALQAATKRAQDALVVYFGGHGRLERSGRRNELHLAPTEASHDHTFDWFPFEWLRRHLEQGKSRARHRILMLDTCHSGMAMEHGRLSTGNIRNWMPKDLDDLSTLLTACDKGEAAQVFDSEGYSAFAAAFIDVLGTGIEGGGEYLTSEDLYNAIRVRIRDAQEPQLLNALGAGSAPLFLNRQRPEGNDRRIGKSTLPMRSRNIVGRDIEIETLVKGARQATKGKGPYIGHVHGRGGNGKSAIIEKVAAELCEDFPQWRLYLDLHTWTFGREARSDLILEELLYQARQPSNRTSFAAEARWRDWLAENQALIILDDVADIEQIKPVLPPMGAQCTLLITSRSPLHGLHADEVIELESLDEASALELLRHHADGLVTDPELIELAKEVGFVPKALNAVGRQLPNIPAEILLDRLRDSGSTAMKESYRDALSKLAPDLRRTAHACAFHPGPDFDVNSICAIAGGTRHEVAEQLHQLVEYRLIEPVKQYRFRLHEGDEKAARLIAEEAEPGGTKRAQADLLTWMSKNIDTATAELWGREKQ